MTLKLSDFAPELLHGVFCFCSQSDLTSLARVNYAFRKAAEYLLRRDIHISFGLFPSISKGKIFRTLISNPQKAALLRYLHVELVCDRWNESGPSNYRMLKQIADALRNAHGLEDLRVIVGRLRHMSRPSDASRGMLSEVIKGGYFQLHTLYCDSYQDLEGIILSQKRLRLLGIYTNHYRSGCVNVSKLINNSRIDGNGNFPGIFMLFCSGDYKIHRLTLFPELCLPGQTFTLFRDIAMSLGQEFGKYDIRPPADRLCRLAIHVFDFFYAKTDIICEVVNAMAQYFVNCEVFTLWVQTSVGNETVSKPWRIPGVSTSICRFKQLQRLNCYVPSDTSDIYNSLCPEVTDLESVLYKEFRRLPELVLACPDDYSMLVWLARGDVYFDKNDDLGDEVYLDTPLID